jgi:hypothetical protein
MYQICNLRFLVTPHTSRIPRQRQRQSQELVVIFTLATIPTAKPLLFLMPPYLHIHCPKKMSPLWLKLSLEPHSSTPRKEISQELHYQIWGTHMRTQSCALITQQMMVSSMIMSNKKGPKLWTLYSTGSRTTLHKANLQ